MSWKFREITKMNIFAATLLLHNLLSATHPPLPSAKRFFIAARQCYLEMKTIKQPYFSILSSIILWIGACPPLSAYTPSRVNSVRPQKLFIQLGWGLNSLQPSRSSCPPVAGLQYCSTSPGHKVMNLNRAQGKPPHTPPSLLILRTFGQHQSPCRQYWELQAVCITALNPQYITVVLNTADRGSDVG